MRPVAWLALAFGTLAACSGSSPGLVGSGGDGGSSTKDGGTDGPADAQGGGDHDSLTTDSGSAADVGTSVDSGAHDASAHDAAHPDASCVPQCTGRMCGEDGCGGSCGACPGGDICDQGQCGTTCTPFCGSAVCGDDGCGGSCGTCPGAYTCVVNGTCQLDPGSQCGPATCGSAASCCHCNGTPTCYSLPPGELCTDLGAGCM